MPVYLVFATLPDTAPYNSLQGQYIPDGTKIGDTIFDTNNGEYYLVRGIVHQVDGDPAISSIGISLAPPNTQL